MYFWKIFIIKWSWLMPSLLRHLRPKCAKSWRHLVRSLGLPQLYLELPDLHVKNDIDCWARAWFWKWQSRIHLKLGQLIVVFLWISRHITAMQTKTEGTVAEQTERRTETGASVNVALWWRQWKNVYAVCGCSQLEAAVFCELYHTAWSICGGLPWCGRSAICRGPAARCPG